MKNKAQEEMINNKLFDKHIKSKKLARETVGSLREGEGTRQKKM